MAFFSDLVRAVALSEGMDEMTVTGIGQYLRDAGLIKKGGRGLSAAKMDCRDAANLLLGVNGTALAKNSPKAVEMFRGLNVKDSILLGTASLQDLAENSRTLGSVVEELIEWCGKVEMSTTKIDRIFEDEVRKSLGRGASGFDTNNDPAVCPRLEVELRRPVFGASVRLFVPRIDRGKILSSVVPVQQIHFDASGLPFEASSSDRRDLTIFTDATLRRVSNAIYS